MSQNAKNMLKAILMIIGLILIVGLVLSVKYKKVVQALMSDRNYVVEITDKEKYEFKNELTENELSDLAKNISYDDIMRYPENNLMKWVQFEGTIEEGSPLTVNYDDEEEPEDELDKKFAGKVSPYTLKINTDEGEKKVFLKVVDIKGMPRLYNGDKIRATGIFSYLGYDKIPGVLVLRVKVLK